MDKVLAKVKCIVFLLATGARPLFDAGGILFPAKCLLQHHIPSCMKTLLPCSLFSCAAPTECRIKVYDPGVDCRCDFVNENVDELVEPRVDKVVQVCMFYPFPGILRSHGCSQTRQPLRISTACPEWPDFRAIPAVPHVAPDLTEMPFFAETVDLQYALDSDFLSC